MCVCVCVFIMEKGRKNAVCVVSLWRCVTGAGIFIFLAPVAMAAAAAAAAAGVIDTL